VKLLLLANDNKLAYKVLRCAAAAAEAVYAYGDRSATWLAASRFCRKFLASSHPVRRDSAKALIPEINRYVAELGISVVISGDYDTSILLASIREHLDASVFPTPDVDVLERLNDKWKFNQLCHDLGILAPQSTLLSRVEELPQLCADGPRRCIVKPIAREGGRGVLELGNRPLQESVRLIDYEPLLLQDYLPGEDICISLYCQAGMVRAAIVYTLGENSIHFTRHCQFERDAARIAKHFAYTGVLCFDGRLSPTGDVSFIECNPRFWNSMDVAMICGVNFVAFGLRDDFSSVPAISNGVAVHHRALSPRDLVWPWKLSPSDVRFLYYRLKDYPFIWEMRKAAWKAA